MKVFEKRGFNPVAVKAGELLRVKRNRGKHAIVGSRMPFEIVVGDSGELNVCIHHVQYSDRKRNPLTAVVALHLPGGVVKELTDSATVKLPVLSIQGWPRLAPHLRTFMLGDVQAVHSIIAELSGAAVTIFASPLFNSPRCPYVAMAYHNADNKWACNVCGALFSTAKELASHDDSGRNIVRVPRVLLVTGGVGSLFKPLSYRARDAWKSQAIKAIEDGNVDDAMKLAPTMKSPSFAKELKWKLESLSSASRR